jgi:hypothetical protein
MENKKKTHTRKEFIGKCLAAGGLLFVGLVGLGGCGSKKNSKQKEKSNAPKTCDDLSDVSKSEIKKRRSFGYVKKSRVQGSHCSNCKLYLPPNDDKSCGGCLLFDGPVEPDGYCMQYEPAS